MSNELLPTRIKELRIDMGLTQKEFAELINVSTVSVSSYETEAKSPSLDMVVNIATKCNVSIDWLCGLSDKKSQGDEIKNYPDLLRALVSLCSVKYEDSNKAVLQPSFTCIPDVHFNVRGDEIVRNFFIEWQKMYELLTAGTIDNELYNLWIEKELAKHKDHPINGIPF